MADVMKVVNMMDETNIVADYLDQMAPTQTHENRHAFEDAASFLRGVDISKGSVSVLIPIKYDNKLIGTVALLVLEHGTLLGGPPNVYCDFLPTPYVADDEPVSGE